jgi:hypothetical protein
MPDTCPIIPSLASLITTQSQYQNAKIHKDLAMRKDLSSASIMAHITFGLRMENAAITAHFQNLGPSKRKPLPFPVYFSLLNRGADKM